MTYQPTEIAFDLHDPGRIPAAIAQLGGAQAAEVPSV